MNEPDDVAELIISNKRNPHKDSFMASESVQEIILQKVAQNAWENELVSKFQKSYVSKTAMHPTYHLIEQRRDEDDEKA